MTDLQQLTNDNIRAAVALWLNDESQAEDTYGHISDWDVSSVTDMRSLFSGAASFNGDISSWDVSSVTIMAWMFNGASSFNGNLSSWDVSIVKIMHNMFMGASSFNGDLSSWDVSSVTDMGGMFANASSFNSDISSWDVSSVTDMEWMFGVNSALSEENQCLIHTSFSSNENWPYDWSEYCVVAFVCGDDIEHDGYDYATVQIGDQCWFSENCRYLPSVSPSSMASSTIPYYYVYGYVGADLEAAKATENYETYGVLYNWPAVMTEGICPSGWDIPSDEEWMELEMSLGMSQSDASSTSWRGTDEGYQMKSTSGWNDGGNGSNSSGFNGLPGGFLYDGGFDNGVHYGYWWSTSESSSLSWFRALNYYNGYVDRSDYYRESGFSARCVKD
jgi:uncharacterized protein (TIGR02145 family)